MKPAVARRRRAALVVTATAALIAGAVVGSASSSGDEEPESAAAPPPTCPDEIAASPSRLAGAMLVVRMEATATDGLRHALRAGTIAGVILFPPSGADPGAIADEVAKLARVATHAGQPPPIVAIDQEGGEVKRFLSLPPDSSPQQMAADGVGATRSQGRKTGRALAKLGINVDLAPVADVPAVDGAFIASRAFGSHPRRVAKLVEAFGDGLQKGGAAATAKHFPGLGRAVANTDLGPSTIDATRHELVAGFAPFRAAVEAGFGLVMVGNATYPAFDDEQPASLSRRIVSGILRKQLAYDGVVITDDLGAGAITGGGYDEGEAAVAGAKAGDDLLLFALSQGEDAHKALTQAIRAHPALEARAEDACARIDALRQGFGA
jgi:beta-N-acetylhexosaminidase